MPPNGNKLKYRPSGSRSNLHVGKDVLKKIIRKTDCCQKLNLKNISLLALFFFQYINTIVSALRNDLGD